MSPWKVVKALIWGIMFVYSMIALVFHPSAAMFGWILVLVALYKVLGL